MFYTVKKLSPEMFQKRIMSYFYDENGNLRNPDDITLTGLLINIGLSKSTFYEYKKLPEYADAAEFAALMVEHSYEVSLKHRGNAGDIFALKNFGWKDSTEQNINAKVNAEVEVKTVEDYLADNHVKA